MRLYVGEAFPGVSDPADRRSPIDGAVAPSFPFQVSKAQAKRRAAVATAAAPESATYSMPVLSPCTVIMATSKNVTSP
jgi:hypothetical protein